MAQVRKARRERPARRRQPIEASRVEPPPAFCRDTGAFPWTDGLAIGWELADRSGRRERLEPTGPRGRRRREDD